MQIIPELVTNADAAIALPAAERGRIVLRVRPARSGVRGGLESARCAACARRRCSTGATSCAAPTTASGSMPTSVDRRLGALGVAPGQRRSARAVRPRPARRVARAGRRSHRGRARRAARGVVVLPGGGDDPYAYVHVRDDAAPAIRRALGVEPRHRVTVPLAAGGRRRTRGCGRLVGQLVQLRPVLEDPARELWLELPGEAAPARDAAAPGARPGAPAAVRRRDRDRRGRAGAGRSSAARREPIPLSPSRATRLGGLVIRSGRAAHETTLAGRRGRPGARGTSTAR